MDHRGSVKLCDFGVSGYLVRSLARTQIGSMSYMAPERIVMDKSEGYSAKADVWSLGLTLVEAATGENIYGPVNFDSPFAQMMAIINDPAPRLPPDQFSPEFQHFIMICLQRKVDDRASFDELLVWTILL